MTDFNQLKADVLEFIRSQFIELTDDQRQKFESFRSEQLQEFAGILKPTMGREIQGLPDLIVLALSQYPHIEPLIDNLTVESLRQMADLLARANAFL